MSQLMASQPIESDLTDVGCSRASGIMLYGMYVCVNLFVYLHSRYAFTDFEKERKEGREEGE